MLTSSTRGAGSDEPPSRKSPPVLQEIKRKERRVDGQKPTTERKVRMKMKKVAALACAAALTLCLAGCSSENADKSGENAEPEQKATEVEQEATEAVTLDKEVSVGRLTAMVSSEWAEEQDAEESIIFLVEGDVFFGVSLTSCENNLPYSGIERQVANYEAVKDNMGWKNFEAAAYGSGTVDGLPCDFMTTSYDYDNNGEIIRAVTYHAYIVAEDGDYWIISSTDWDLLNQILDTVTIA